jgi:hypothetical protein
MFASIEAIWVFNRITGVIRLKYLIRNLARVTRIQRPN